MSFLQTQLALTYNRELEYRKLYLEKVFRFSFNYFVGKINCFYECFNSFNPLKTGDFDDNFNTVVCS